MDSQTTVLDSKKEDALYSLADLMEFFSTDTTVRNDYRDSDKFYAAYDSALESYKVLNSLVAVYFPNLISEVDNLRGGISCFRGYFRQYVQGDCDGRSEASQDQLLQKVTEAIKEVSRSGAAIFKDISGSNN